MGAPADVPGLRLVRIVPVLHARRQAASAQLAYAALPGHARACGPDKEQAPLMLTSAAPAAQGSCTRCWREKKPHAPKRFASALS